MKEQTIPAGYEKIEDHIRRARLQRSLAIANLIANGLDAFGRGLARFAASMGAGLAAARNARAVEAEALFKLTALR